MPIGRHSPTSFPMLHADRLAMSDLAFDDATVVAARPPRNILSPWEPYAFCHEQECGPRGVVDPVSTVFLTNRECPFRCVMCDLWKNTLTSRVPVGAIPAQIEFALARLPPARHIKLYNSGNFFDAQAIPPEDHGAIAQQVREFETVVVENHPKLCGPSCAQFQSRLEGTLEVAMGLETVHPDVLRRLNKRMGVDDYDRAAAFLLGHGMAIRTFVLLSPPFMAADEASEWCLRSIGHAFSNGSRVCSIIPTRGGNGAMEQLAARGKYAPPTLGELEAVHAAALAQQLGRVFVDLWDVERFASCTECAIERIARLDQMNRQQQVAQPIPCSRCGGSQ